MYPYIEPIFKPYDEDLALTFARCDGVLVVVITVTVGLCVVVVVVVVVFVFSVVIFARLW